jgi:hypothetical protein
MTCSITIERGRTLVLGAALQLAGFPPSTTGRFSGVHRGLWLVIIALVGLVTWLLIDLLVF